ncbi:hypothetical protein NP493_545g01093 [Ridgeia piscesae]|uniref:Uncharacterized protein n=1 Tax=Ridgeia piscesae TaxID=27915 RepID=A0AAD9KVZ8_RIDPI|nr:hypothetical protein NP493_545g01093 [Ridgeia piscesae]
MRTLSATVSGQSYTGISATIRGPVRQLNLVSREGVCDFCQRRPLILRGSLGHCLRRQITTGGTPPLAFHWRYRNGKLYRGS